MNSLFPTFIIYPITLCYVFIIYPFKFVVHLLLSNYTMFYTYYLSITLCGTLIIYLFTHCCTFTIYSITLYCTFTIQPITLCYTLIIYVIMYRLFNITLKSLQRLWRRVSQTGTSPPGFE